MRINHYHETLSLIERSERILLCTHRKPDGDAVGSIMGLTKALQLLGKDVTATCADQLPESFQFLPSVKQVQQAVPAGHEFVVTLDCEHAEVDRLKYHLEDNKIHIVITPKNGHFTAKDVSCHDHADAYDLIITVDVADIPQLGKLYDEHVQLFTTVPVINIDHHVSNTGFGKINVIDVSASSTAEILYGLIREMEGHFGKSLINAEVATFLLSGVTTDTGSFQNANTTAKAMEVAAELMDAGANQQDIIKYLFRTKKLSTLKLWGRVLTKIELDTPHRLVWSSISQQDLKATQAPMDSAGEIIDELLVHAPEADIVALFKEDPDLISVSMRSKSAQVNVMEVVQMFGGGGHVQAAGAKFPGKSLAQVMTLILAELQRRQAERLGLKPTENKADGKKITQVLDGYTPAPAAKMTLEDQVMRKASAKPQVVPETKLEGSGERKPEPKFEPKPAPKPVQPALAPVKDVVTPAPKPDMHEQTAQAIAAEQREPSDEAGPSKAAEQQRNKPAGGVREAFPEDRNMPEPALPEDDGVKVKFNSPAASANPFAETLEDGLEAGSNQALDNLPQTPPPTPPSPSPATPKDPFAQGDDGLTDIERALGGL